MIKKSGSKFVVTNKSGTKVLGTHPSKEKAQKQLAAIEISKAKHMKENTKRFKDFRNTLSESEYKETLTGYPNRSLDTDVGAIKFNAEYLANANAMLNALSKYTYLNPTDAFVKIKARLNVLMLDFPWTPRVWAGHGQIPPGAPETDNAVVGEFVLAVTRFGRVDGYDGQTGNIRFDGRAASQDGFQEFDLKVRIELGDDSMYRVTAKLAPKTEPVMAEEGVEVDGDALDEMAQTPARQRDMEHKIQRHEAQAQKGYEAKMTKTGKAAARGRKLEAKHDAASRRVIKQDTKEYESEKLYGRGGKIVKSKSKPVKEGAEQIDEMAQTASRQKEMERKIAKQDDRADRAYTTKMNSPSEKVAAQANKRLNKAEKKVNALLARDNKEFESPRTYGRSGKLVKRGSRHEVKEGAEQIDEAGQAKLERLGKAYDKARIGSRGVSNPKRKKELGDAYFSMRDKVLDKRKKRIESGTFDKEKELTARIAHNKKTYGKGVFGSLFGKKTVKEGAEQIEELSKATKDAYVAKRGSQLSSMLSGHKHSKQLTGKQQANAVKGIKQAMGVQEELVGGQKKLDVNKNKKLDSHDFKLLRAKKTVKEETVEEGKKFKAWTPRLDKLMANRDAVRSKPKKSILTQKVEGGKKIGAARPIAAVKEDVTTEFATGLPVMEPALGSNIADQSGKGTKRIKKTVKEATTKKPVKKPSPHTGASNVIDRQKTIKDTLNKHGMRW